MFDFLVIVKYIASKRLSGTHHIILHIYLLQEQVQVITGTYW